MPGKLLFRRTEDWDPKQVYLIAKLFFEDGMKARSIRDLVNERFQLVGKAQWTHQNIFSAIVRARQMGWVRFSPPVEAVLASELQREFNLLQMPVVVQPPTQGENHLVAAKGAEAAFKFILDRQGEQVFDGRQASPVSIGLGVGRASLDFARHLNELIQGHKYRSRFRLNLHAVTAGCASESPFYSAASLFNIFDRQNIKDAVGLFSQTICQVNEYEKVRSQSGYASAYARRGEIHLIANSMGCDDPHDLLSLSLKEEGVDIAKWTDELGVVGNVQYRPYGANGPVHERQTDHRAVTLFEIPDFVRLSEKPDRLVLLMSRQCGLCGPESIETRAKAVYHLLTQKDLLVFNKLILEEALAVAVLGIAENKKKEQQQKPSPPVTISSMPRETISPPAGKELGRKRSGNSPKTAKRKRPKKRS